MTPFLRQVASKYLAEEGSSISDYCFVFPNKRSCTFFQYYLTQEGGDNPFFLPEIATITEMIRSFSELSDAPRLEQLFILYKEYRKISEDVGDFDSFLFWGDMLLNDFNDVDLSLADPEKLFVNIERLREISADYLTDEQKEILNRYWGGTYPLTSPDTFWRHIHDEPSQLQQKFIELWKVLFPLYKSFRKELNKRGLATHGMFMHNALRYLSDNDKELPFRRYVFVGFNVLTLAEIRLFEILKKRGCADFYWDIASPAFNADGNRAALFMKRNVEHFPSLYDLSEAFPEQARFPVIHITGIPGSFAQTKVAGKQLKTWLDQHAISEPDNAINTAVVLPDESLFIPMSLSIPEKLTSVNITMGYPLKSTSVSSLMATIVNLQLNCKRKLDTWAFYYEDVRSVLTHPLVKLADPEESTELLRQVMSRRQYLIEEKFIADNAPALKFIFTPLHDVRSIDEVNDYFYEILIRLERIASRTDEHSLDSFVLKAYLSELSTLYALCKKEGMEMRESTFIQLLQNTISSSEIRFDGKPLKGLQIMGMLETRALDFDNLIMLSMNERIFPRKHMNRSFIPDTLRKSYGLSTGELQESIFAYSFYRLISRASNVRLFYDARTVGTKNNEISRYIVQLLYLFPECQVIHDIGVFPSGSSTTDKIEIEKSREILDELENYKTEGGLSLSASSINTYINCPLSFYLERICKLKLDEEINDYIDNSTYGTIVHEVIERIYDSMLGDKPQVKVTSDDLDGWINDNIEIDRLLTVAINENYNKLPEGDETPLTGENAVSARMIKSLIKRLLAEEKKQTPFYYIAGEKEIKARMKINDELTINITQYIDRIDRLINKDGSTSLRIIDYKTGSDENTFTSIEQLFDSTLQKRPKAILQLLFYCNAYANYIKSDEPIKPMLYLLRKIVSKGIEPLKMDRVPIEDYHSVNEEFLELFNAKIAEIFDPDVPFTQTENVHNCTYCSFKAVCRK